jgi:3-oxoacyl-[acyl-carrier protein] reductase
VVKQPGLLRVLITGAANGIGRATAIAFRDAGARVVGLDLMASEDPVPVLACDLRREQDIVSAVRAAVKALGGLDVVVNNAGILREAPSARSRLRTSTRISPSMCAAPYW